MPRLLRRCLAVLLAPFAFAMPVSATTFSTDFTDLWYIPAESGWGVNVIQQYDTIFSTLFVYGSDGTPRWFVAPNTTSVAAPAGERIFTGPLYSTTGTFFGVPWAGSSYAQVGSITFSFPTATTAVMSYTVSGTTVTKSIVRQTWRGNVLTGNYIGGVVAVGSNCAGGNTSILINGELTISHINTSPTMRVDFINSQGAAGQCTYTGNYFQEGRMGSVTGGTYSCQIAGVSNPPAGTFTLTQVEANTKGLNARFTGQDQYCANYDGYFGGVRDVF